MNYSSAKLLAVVLLVLLQWDSVTVSGAEREFWEEERLALLLIKDTLTIPIHSAEGEWKGTDCCRWERVTCDHTTGHVTELDLSIRDFDDDEDEYYLADEKLFLNATMFLPLHQLKYLVLSGHGIPGFMAGAGVETWSNLTKLEVLDLSDNRLNGSIIFPLARILSLRKLILAYNHMGDDGAPIEGIGLWSNLTKLETLDLTDNSITSMDISSLAAINSLRALYLDFNSIGRYISITDFSALNLEVLSLTECGFIGSLPHLGDLSPLRALSLGGNLLNGTLESKGLCQLKSLEELDLSINNLTGNLPPCMGNMSSLKLVDLSYNQFQVNFPSSIFERLVSLRYLSLSNNPLEGTLFLRSLLNHSNLEVLRLSTKTSNFRVKVVNLPLQLQDLDLSNCIVNGELTFLYFQYNLRVLDLSNTRSKGPLPSAWLLENNTNLIKLDLHKNSFTGPLQLPFVTHEKLLQLDISDNHLDGELVDIATKLPNLVSLNLSKNWFQGPLPPIPTINLGYIDMSTNNLTDDIQKIESMFRLSNSSKIIGLDLSHNRLYGSFTNNMNVTGAPVWFLNNNSISGKFPMGICSSSFTILDVSNNELNGLLPDCIGRANITQLNLSGNHFEGPLPLEICSIRNLHLLDLSDNKFSGSIPSCSYNDSSLEIVNLSQNNLTGNFPITWLNISQIKIIDIAENRLSGEFPALIGMESTLQLLQARENLFRGQIPEQICQLKYLRILDLSNNNLSGQVPSCIIDMGLVDRDFNFSRFETISSELGELKFPDANFHLHIFGCIIWSTDLKIDQSIKVGLEFMSKGRLDSYWGYILQIDGAIDLSANKLEGNIPNEIGQMNWLITLNLSNNHFRGSIPKSLSNLSQLQSLDLSRNFLTGEIPRDMTKLTYLESFSVAYNNLSGPTLGDDSQFITFNSSSYEGNPDLCGPPLPKSCFPTLDTFPSVNKDKRHEGTDFLILFGSFSLFFVISFWCFMAVLYFKRDWRYALFTLADWYGDMIYVRVVLLVRKIGAARTERDN